MTGKWHLTAEDEMNMASRKAQWPVGRGFERFYGFLGAETNQWYPDLVYDNHPVEQPALPSQGYHLTVDLTDKALEFIRDAKAVAPDKPFFLYFAGRVPRAAPRAEGVDRQVPRQVHGLRGVPGCLRAAEAGVITGKAELSPINPYIDATSAREGLARAPFGPDPHRRSSCCPDGRGVRGLPPQRAAADLDRAGSSTTRSSSWCRTTGPPARAAQWSVDEANCEELGSGDVPDRLGVAFNTPFKLWKRTLRGRHRRPDDRLVAGPDHLRRFPPPVRARRRHRADPLLAPGG